jgi:AraC family transcriptional regulator
MEPVRKAIWYIESHYAEPIGADDIARASGLSRYQLSRVFVARTGHTLSAYLRGRRLTAAAKALAAGARDIQALALDTGYGSHEAFTRAFRDQFGATPESVRSAASTEHLHLLETPTMPETPTTPLRDPVGPLLLAGLRAFRNFGERAGIPEQWQHFAPHIGHVPQQTGGETYGVCLTPSDPQGDGFDYLAAVAVRSLDELPEALSGLRLARRRYACFKHEGHVSAVGATCEAIFGHWAPGSGRELESEPLFLIERYGSGFNPQTGLGDIELWIPLAA